MSNKRQCGFTLIEVLVVLAIIATLLSLVTPRYFSTIDRSKETVLRHDLYVVRDAIDKFYSDNNRFPNTLEELVQRKYIRQVPQDPITESQVSWVFTPPSDRYIEGIIADLHSGSDGIAADGTRYASW
ncbi:MAG: type II secretion system protein G [Gammaproteobacteria bacterium]|nr:MAG: type II secretion system protein G [Gammaproteobacteria bacterium]